MPGGRLPGRHSVGSSAGPADAEVIGIGRDATGNGARPDEEPDVRRCDVGIRTSGAVTKGRSGTTGRGSGAALSFAGRVGAGGTGLVDSRRPSRRSSRRPSRRTSPRGLRSPRPPGGRSADGLEGGLGGCETDAREGAASGPREGRPPREPTLSFRFVPAGAVGRAGRDPSVWIGRGTGRGDGVGCTKAGRSANFPPNFDAGFDRAGC